MSLTRKSSSGNATEPENLISMLWIRGKIRKISMNQSGIPCTRTPLSRFEPENGNEPWDTNERDSLNRLILKRTTNETRLKRHSRS